ncbi:nucleotidyltransferase domain-containing protein [Hoeflea sp. AS60]|uniref:nucleotidyltransferase domain-containing protein n=1 Tax=Hoeflea sp. AS60 TaxID=3135780 RepID=UPI00317B969B
MEYLATRKVDTELRLSKLQAELKDSANQLGDKACVYATGSFGRLEAGSKSDLDLFIVSKIAEVDGATTSQLRNLDAILVKAELIRAIRKMSIPDFDADGKYLGHYSVTQFTSSIGAPDDDASNTLTGRLLLFLESRPLLGEIAYSDIIDDVIASYWRDYGDHAEGFMPAFLANDILRLWRTFCVNYEAKTVRDPHDKKIEGKIKNYKLKHSRMLTCYSALLYLLGVFELDRTVSPERAKIMTQLTPTDRLRWLLEKSEFEAVHSTVYKLLEKYAEFLKRTDQPKDQLIAEFEKNSKEWMTESYEFGDLMFDALSGLGGNNRFYRLIVV